MPVPRAPQHSVQQLSHDVTSFSMPSNQSDEREREVLRDINNSHAKLMLPIILIIVLFLIIGLLGNPLAIYIYGWRWPSTSTRIFLFTLAVIDLLNCLVTIPTEIISMRNYYDFPSDALCKVSRSITYMFNNATVIILLSVAIDRYIRICHPFKRAVSARNAKIACGVGVLLGLIVSWPALFLYKRTKFQVPTKLKQQPAFVTGALCLAQNTMTFRSIAFFICLFSAFFFAVLILVILYSMIGCSIWKRERGLQQRRKAASVAKNTNLPKCNAWRVLCSACIPRRMRRQVTAEESQGRGTLQNSLDHGIFHPQRATQMVFLATVVFITSFLPFLVISFIRNRGPTFYLELDLKEEIVVNVFKRSYVIHSCINPIVYGLCNSQFWGECKRLFFTLCCKDLGQAMPSYYIPSGEQSTFSPERHTQERRNRLELCADSTDQSP